MDRPHFPAPKQYVYAGGKVWGRMPCGDILEFDSPFLYFQQYKAEEDEMYDEMARLTADQDLIEVPEDFVLA